MLREAALAGLSAGAGDVDGLLGGAATSSGGGPSTGSGGGAATGSGGAKAEIGIDWAMVNAEVLRWVEAYAFELIRGLDARSRSAVGEAIQRWASNGLPLADLVEELAPIFGPVRAELIAATEVTRAYAEANLRAWRASGVIERVTWRTANDERVCFPAGTMVETANGPRPIQDITPGMHVLTRMGLRCVRATSKRNYRGAMVRVFSEVGTVTATADHPFWTLEKGWLAGGKLDASYHLETFCQQAVKVLDVHNFSFGDPADTPAMRFEKTIFSQVARRIAMPVDAINFEGNTQVGQQEVNAIAPNLRFLDERDAQSGQSIAHGLLEHVLACEGTITGERAELPVFAGLFADRASTIAALDIFRGTPAILRAKVAVEAFLGAKDFAATFAGDVAGFGGTAFSTANRELMRLRAVDDERLAANGAGLCDLVGLGYVIASSATKAATAGNSRRLTIHKFPAYRAGDFLSSLRSWFGRHIAHLLIAFDVFYHRLSAKSIAVYDLEVDGVPEFYANGVLVHNCPVCSALGGVRWGADGAVPTAIADQVADGVVTPIGQAFVHPGGNGAQARWAGQAFRAPPAHPRCRCWLAPVV